MYLRTICELTLVKKITNLIGDRIILCPVQDGEEKQILDYKVKFFDIRSTKARQFGFVTTLNNGKASYIFVETNHTRSIVLNMHIRQTISCMKLFA